METVAEEPPPPPPRQMNGDEMPQVPMQRYIEKIRRQAGELLSVQEQLEASVRYAKMCEDRLLQLQPAHKLPITPQMLDEGGAVNASTSMEQASMSQRVPSKGVPSHIFSADAKLRRQQLEAAGTINKLQKQITALEAKLEEYAKQHKQLKSLAETREREARHSKSRTQSLQAEVQDLRQRLSDGSDVNTSRVSRTHTATHEEMQALADAVRREKSVNQDLRTRVHVLEEALELHADELGLKGSEQGQLLAEVARLRGENAALIRDTQRFQAKAAELEKELLELRGGTSSLRDRLRAEEKRVCELEDELRVVSRGDVYARLKDTQAERDALLEYIQDSTHKTAALQEQLKELTSAHQACQARESALQSQLTKASEVEAALKLAQKEVRENLAVIESAKTCELKLREALGDKQAEIDELARLQDELLNQLRASHREAEKRDKQLKEAARDMKTLEGRIMELDDSFRSREKTLAEKEAQLRVAVDRVSYVEPELRCVTLQRDELKQKVDQLTEVLAGKRVLEAELETLRPLQSAITDLEAHIRATHVQSQPHDRSSRHTPWVTSEALNKVSSALATEAQQVLQDLTAAQSESERAVTEIEHIREEHAMVRQQLLDRALAAQKQADEMACSKRRAVEDLRALREEIDRAREAEDLLEEVQSMVVSAVLPRSRVDRVELPSLITQLLQEREEFAEQMSSLEAKLHATESARDSAEWKLQEAQHERVAAEQALAALEARTEADESLRRSEAVSLRAELQAVTQVCEKHNAHTAQLEREVECVREERRSLEAQLEAMQAELSEASDVLVEGMVRVHPVIRAVTRTFGMHSLDLPDARGPHADGLQSAVRIAGQTFAAVQQILKDRGFIDSCWDTEPQLESTECASPPEPRRSSRIPARTMVPPQDEGVEEDDECAPPPPPRAPPVMKALLASPRRGGDEYQESRFASQHTQAGPSSPRRAGDEYRQNLLRLQQKYRSKMNGREHRHTLEARGDSHKHTHAHTHTDIHTGAHTHTRAHGSRGRQDGSVDVATRNLQDRVKAAQSRFASLYSES